MIKLLNFFFGKRKDGKCRWWQHKYDNGKHEEWMSDTGTFLEGKPLQKKFGWTKYTCGKCGDTWTSDIRRVWW